MRIVGAVEGGTRKGAGEASPIIGEADGCLGVSVNVFNAYPGDYDSWYDRNRFAFLSEVAALKKALPRKGRGFELGVGTGRFAQALGVPLGLDPARHMLEIARERGIETILGRGENLPFKDEIFDFLLMVITLCFVDDPVQVISESRRVLKHKGKIIIGIIDRESRLGEFYLEKKRKGHKFYREANFFSTREVIEMLRKHNFKEITTYQTIFQPLEEMKKVTRPRKGFGKGGFTVISGEIQKE